MKNPFNENMSMLELTNTFFREAEGKTREELEELIAMQKSFADAWWEKASKRAAEGWMC